MSFNIKINGADTVPPEMQEALQEGAQAGLEVVGVKGAQMVQDNITTPYGDLPPAVAFGNLAASIVSTYVREPAGMGVIIGVGNQLNAAAYAAPVETGARPHMPPPSALVPWVMKKFGAADEKTALSIAFAISKSMEKKGTRGHDMFIRALEALQPIAGPAIEHSIAQAFMRHGFVPLVGLA